MKKILGLDLGTNSIGWALVERDVEKGEGRILGMGSRIIPTDAEMLSKYETGQSASKNSKRRQERGSRRLRFRYKLRRERLSKALKLLGWLDDSFRPGSRIPVSEGRISDMCRDMGTDGITEDWIVYYLRHIGLQEKLDRSELAMVLLNMNQRRGFLSNRKNQSKEEQEQDDEENEKKSREKTIELMTVVSVEDTGEIVKGNTLYRITFSDGRSGIAARRTLPDWQDKRLELEITTIPPTKKSAERIEIRALGNSDQDNWAKQKLRREKDIEDSGHVHPGNYFYHKLKEGNGFIIRDVTISRRFYVRELEAILRKQIELDPGLNDSVVIEAIAEELYPRNREKQKELKGNDICHLLLKDIIYYQRPLKSKKSSIGDCRFERKNHRDAATGKLLTVKAAPISSPVFQEFRIWQNINNIRILKREYRDDRGRLVMEQDVTEKHLDTGVLEKLFELFDGKEKVKQTDILKNIGLDPHDYLVNLYRQSEDKEIPGNETKHLIRKFFRKAGLSDLCEEILRSRERLFLLWHIFYSLERREDIANALKRNFALDEEKAAAVSAIPAFKQQYGSLSNKAMQRLLPLMRTGRHWTWDSIEEKVRTQLDRILDGEFDEGVSLQVRDLFKRHSLEKREDCRGMLVPMACYAVYGIHSERDAAYYEEPEQLIPKEPLNLRNPIVEQVVNECLRLVRDVWKTHGRPYEVHVELARDLKKNRQEREEISRTISRNEQENIRISSILREMGLGNPNSLSDIERLKVWETQADEQTRSQLQDIRFKRPGNPTKEEIERYRIWSSQSFLSPYTGRAIPLSRLFSREYDVDHIIPRSRFFDDSIENKVVVESDLNRDKGNKTAYEYIIGGSPKGHRLFSKDEYEAHVTKYFFRKKRLLLLSEDVPERFTQRQLTDSRYITRKIAELLSPVSENTKDPVIHTNGAVTAELRSAWGIGEKMKDIVLDRFERLEEKTGEKYISHENEIGQDGKPTGRKILRLRDYHKRIDHRHHALDALVVACTTRSHIKYLNDLNASHYRKANEGRDGKMEYGALLRKNDKDGFMARKFRMPWDGFINETMEILKGVVVSFRNRPRIFGRKANRNTRFIQTPDGGLKKALSVVRGADGRPKMAPYVRQPLHKGTLMGAIDIREEEKVSVREAFIRIDQITKSSEKKLMKDLLDASEGDVGKALKLYKSKPILDETDEPKQRISITVASRYFANRTAVSSLDGKKIEDLPDHGLRKRLKDHMKEIDDLNAGRPKDQEIKAFEGEGLEILNRGRRIPIMRIKRMEKSESKFEIRPGAFTEAEKGTNLFFVVHEELSNPLNRIFSSIPLRDIIEAKASGSGFVEDIPGFRWFTLSPNDLVYMPDEEENLDLVDWNDKTKVAQKIYKMVSCNKKQCFFMPQSFSKVIVDKTELGSMNKEEKDRNGRMIKQFCIKLSVNRLGEVSPA